MERFGQQLSKIFREDFEILPHRNRKQAADSPRKVKRAAEVTTVPPPYKSQPFSLSRPSSTADRHLSTPFPQAADVSAAATDSVSAAAASAAAFRATLACVN